MVESYNSLSKYFKKIDLFAASVVFKENGADSFGSFFDLWKKRRATWLFAWIAYQRCSWRHRHQRRQSWLWCCARPCRSWRSSCAWSCASAINGSPLSCSKQHLTPFNDISYYRSAGTMETNWYWLLVFWRRYHMACFWNHKMKTAFLNDSIPIWYATKIEETHKWTIHSRNSS